MLKEKAVLVATFIIGVPLMILLNLYLFTQLSFSWDFGDQLSLIEPSNQPVTDANWAVLSSREKNGFGVNGVVLAADARPIIIKKYLEKYNSPLVPYSDLIFEASQKYGLDYRLIVAIAQQESNLCKKAPENCFNCWGVGIHSRGTMCFDSYPKGIKWFARYLKEEYIDKGMNTPEEMMPKYCPLSNGSWAFGVNQFMNELK
jgi:hypothetical protein